MYRLYIYSGPHASTIRPGSRAAAVCGGVHSPAGAPGTRGRRGPARGPLRGDALAQHRAAARRADQGDGRRREPAVHLLYGHGQRRRVEDDQRRPHVDPDLRRPADRLDRIDRGRRRPIPTSSTSAAAKGCSGPTSRSATACTSRPTRARRGRISASATRSRSRASRSIRRIPNRLFVAALGHPYGPNEERGIFRSTDGGASFQTRAVQRREHRRQGRRHRSVESRHRLRDAARRTRRVRGRTARGAARGGVFKSTDGGTTWKELTQGSARRRSINAELTIAPSDPKRIYAYATGGTGGGGRGGRGAGGVADGPPPTAPFYRSDDGGETWTAPSNDTRVGSSNEASICVDPKNPDWLIVTSIVTFKSRGRRQVVGPVQGRAGRRRLPVRVDQSEQHRHHAGRGRPGGGRHARKGRSWSSWYNQPTAAMFHITTDNAFPYRVCGGQQDSGSACVASRGNDGAITFREWHPAGIEEYGYAAPDPLDPDIVYGTKEVTQLRPAHRAGVERRAARRPRRGGADPARQPAGAHAADRLFAGRQQVALLRHQRAVEDDGRRDQLEADQPRPDAQDPRDPEERRQVHRAGADGEPGRRQRRARHLHHRAVVQGRQPHLGRHRRRRDRDDGGRRPALDRRHAEGDRAPTGRSS